MTTTTDLLPIAEQAALDRCEAIIARGVQTFIEVGEALAEIREARLYRAEHGTFEDYCRDRWGIGGSRARQLIGASSAARHIESVTTVTLSNEAQARPLVGLAPDQQVAAYQQAHAATNGKPTARDVRQAAAEIAPPAAERVALVAAHQAELADMQRRFAVFDWKLTPHGLWYKLVKPDGTLYATETTLARFVTRLSEMERSRANRIARDDPAYNETPPATPALADIFLRLDAHGYAKSGTRTKGMTTFYSFRDYSGRSDATGGEIELAEGELGYWLAELDTSASYAQAKQEKFIDAQGRAARLGYDLTRDGAQFELTPEGKRVPAMRGTLDQLIKVIEGYEKNAAKKSAVSDSADRKAKEQEDRSLLSTAKANIGTGNIGDARKLLAQVQVSTWERDQLLRTLDIADARRFLADQRERLTRFSPSAMVSLTTYTQALDHIAALLEVSE